MSNRLDSLALTRAKGLRSKSRDWRIIQSMISEEFDNLWIYILEIWNNFILEKA